MRLLRWPGLRRNARICRIQAKIIPAAAAAAAAAIIDPALADLAGGPAVQRLCRAGV
ncbi:MAG: hypothetical protein V4462_17555 [Pseudomonadota bacterium]